MHRCRSFQLLICFSLLVGPVRSAVAQDTPQFRQYQGRPIAPVMSWRAWRWLVRPDRDLWEKPETVLDALGVRPGQVVADVGTGVGYFAIRLARRVGPAGRVYAVDVQPGMIRLLRQRLQQYGVRNVVPVLSDHDDPKLPAAAVDLALMVDVYHEIQEPEPFMRRLADALAPGGRLVLIEYRAEDPNVPIRPEHKMELRQVRRELEQLGFRLAELHEFLPRQHIIGFHRQHDHAASPFPFVYVPLGQVPTGQQWREGGFAPAESPQIALRSPELELDFVLRLSDAASFVLRGKSRDGDTWKLTLGPGAKLRLVDASGSTFWSADDEVHWIRWETTPKEPWRLTLRFEDGTIRVAVDGYPLKRLPVALPFSEVMHWSVSGQGKVEAAWVKTGAAGERAESTLGKAALAIAARD